MSRKRKRRLRQAKKKGAGATKSSRFQAAATSPHLEVAAALERMTRYVGSGSSREAAVAAARDDLRRAVEKVHRLARGLGPITVVSSVRVSMILTHATTGDEPSPAALELVALVLVARSSVTSEARSGPVADSDFMPPAVQAAAKEAVAAGSMIPLLDAASTGAEGALLFYSIQREITLRNAVYPHMLLDTLRDLFSDPDVNNDCRDALGFTGLEAVDVMDAVRSTASDALASRFQRMEEARNASLPCIRSWADQDKHDAQLPAQEHRAAAQEVFDALQALTTHITQATVIDPDAIAWQTGHERATVDRVLDRFTLTGLTELDEALGRFFRGDNPLRTSPIIVDAQGRRMLVHDALALPAVREVIEVGLTAASRENAYERHRGRCVENTAVDLLAGVFPGATVYRGFKYFVPDPRSAEPEVEPEVFTKRVEGDGLLLIDDVALIVEVKSVALTAEARGGVARRLRGKLRDIVTSAADQAERLRQRITSDGRIRLEDGKWIDVSGIREIHTIAVGLEDLSGVTTATATLVAAGILKPENIPWTVSVHDLRIVAEVLDRPSDLLLYLRRRTHPAATWKYRAVDELDLFMLFLTRGLYVEPDPRQVAAALRWSSPPSPQELLRFAEQRPEMVGSHTGVLDDWYASHFEALATATGKPKLGADQKLLRLVDQVIQTGAPGWLSTAASLLEGDAQVQRMFGRYATDLGRLVRRDGKHHSITHLMGETTGRHVLLVWACHARDEEPETAAAYLSTYLQAKKHQVGAYRATCLLFDPTGGRLLRLIYDNRTTEADPLLEDAVRHLVPLHEMKAATPRRARPQRGRR